MGETKTCGFCVDCCSVHASAQSTLEVLKRCEELLSNITDIRWDLAEFRDGYLRQARAAIAKAEGVDNG